LISAKRNSGRCELGSGLGWNLFSLACVASQHWDELH
jgi:hypothetical protein